MSDMAGRLAEFIVHSSIDDPAVEEKARVLLCDAFVLGLKARSLPAVVDAAEASSEGVGSVTRWIDGEKIPRSDAVFANAFAVHARFQDDCEMSSWTHPASIVAPVVVGVAESEDKRLDDVLAGLVVGYAVAHWMGAKGEVAHAIMDRGFRPSPIFGPIMATAAAARVAGLSVEACAEGLRAAVLLARGTLHSVANGGTDWRIHNASSAVDGLYVALVGSIRPGSAAGSIEGPRGFLGVYAGMKEPPDAWGSPPTERSVLTVWHKPAPTLGDNVAAYIAARKLSREIDTPQIRSITIEAHDGFVAFPGTQGVTPFDTDVEAIASMRYAVVRALLDGRLRWHHYTEDQRNDPAVARLIAATEVHGRRDLSPTDAVVRVEMADGKTFEHASADEDLATILYRNPEEARRSAGEILGEEGKQVANSIFASSLDTPCSELIDAIAGER